VEYIIPGIRQLDLREEGILSFSDGVRSILRQDPDVLLIGEIRDEKTAASALRASLTGRLVLSTLHASTPLEALRRLMDLKLSLSDFVPSLIGIFSQRLVRYKIGNTYIGRFPITEYIYFPQEVKENILKTNDISQCKLDKSFIESAKFAISKNMTDGCEIKRMLGDVDL
jgi:Tfp pilus assembly pilus retraction ATPase PilT